MSTPEDNDEDEIPEPTNLREAAQHVVDTWEMEGCDRWDLESAIETLKEFL